MEHSTLPFVPDDPLVVPHLVSQSVGSDAVHDPAKRHKKMQEFKDTCDCETDILQLQTSGQVTLSRPSGQTKDCDQIGLQKWDRN